MKNIDSILQLLPTSCLLCNGVKPSSGFVRQVTICDCQLMYF